VTSDEFLLLTGGSPAPPAHGLRGQFVIEAVNPFVSMGFPNAIPDRFFVNELDTLYGIDKARAQAILDRYIGLGGRHTVALGFGKGYKGHFPDSNWLVDPDGFAGYLRWLDSHGVAVTLCAAPDCEPYYNENTRTFNRAAMERDFTPFYARLRELGVIPPIIMSQYEQWQDFDESAWLWDWLTRTFPTEERIWHNPPGHLGPGPSDAPEAMCAEHVVVHGCTGWAYQGDPPGAYVRNSDGRTPLQQTLYDLADLVRRLKHGYAGWPTKTPQGGPISVRFMEATAYAMYWWGYTQATAQEWGTAVLTVEGITDTCDGLP